MLRDAANADETAAALIAEFGSIGGALNGSARRQLAASGGDAHVVMALASFRDTLTTILERRMIAGPVLSNWQALLDYLHNKMAYATIESVRLLHLNTRNGLMLDEEISRGSIDQATVYVREVIVRALEVGSASIILVHNHPSGDPSPSRADIEITRAIINAGKTIGLTVHDHFVVGANGHVSLRARGLI